MKSFEVLKEWVDNIKRERFIYDEFPKLIKDYLSREDWDVLHEMFINNSQSNENYLKLFFKNLMHFGC